MSNKDSSRVLPVNKKGGTTTKLSPVYASYVFAGASSTVKAKLHKNLTKLPAVAPIVTCEESVQIGNNQDDLDDAMENKEISGEKYSDCYYYADPSDSDDDEETFHHDVEAYERRFCKSFSGNTPRGQITLWCHKETAEP